MMNFEMGLVEPLRTGCKAGWLSYVAATGSATVPNSTVPPSGILLRKRGKGINAGLWRKPASHSESVVCPLALACIKSCNLWPFGVSIGIKG